MPDFPPNAPHQGVLTPPRQEAHNAGAPPAIVRKVKLAGKQRKTKEIAQYDRLSPLADSQEICPKRQPAVL
jgi:hypothetical protein